MPSTISRGPCPKFPRPGRADGRRLADRVGDIVAERAPLQIMDSGGGTLPMDRFPAELSAFVAHLAENPPEIDVESIALSDVEDSWNRPQDGRRFVFTP